MINWFVVINYSVNDRLVNCFIRYVCEDVVIVNFVKFNIKYDVYSIKNFVFFFKGVKYIYWLYIWKMEYVVLILYVFFVYLLFVRLFKYCFVI